MAVIAVDVGNSKSHFAVYDALPTDDWPEPRRQWSMENSRFADARSVIDADLPAEDCDWFVVSVNRAAEQNLARTVERRDRGESYRLLSAGDVLIEDAVKERGRVGVDRLMAAFAANKLRKADRPAIVVDAGTAVTVDLVDAAGVFQGGVILPGLSLTAQALDKGTDALPLIEFAPGAEPPPVIGKSTEQAIRAGLFWGIVGAVREIVARAGSDLTASPQLFVTGGDAERMTPLLAADARFVPDLVVGGILLAAAALQRDTL